jgi:hypothetical protein
VMAFGEIAGLTDLASIAGLLVAERELEAR